jgi:hypothetical protein
VIKHELSGGFPRFYSRLTAALAGLLFVIFAIMAVEKTASAYSSTIGAIAFALLAVAFFVLFSRFIINRFSARQNIVFCVFCGLLFALLCVLSVEYFAVWPSWDYSWTAYTSSLIGQYQAIPEDILTYFHTYPFNFNVAYYLGLIMRITDSTMLGAYIANFASLMLGFLGLLLTAKDTGGLRLASKAALLCLFTSALYLYMPIVYTDTLTLPYPIWSYYFANRALRTGEKRLRVRILQLCLSGVMGGMAFFLKAPALIITLGIVLHTLIVSRSVLQSAGKMLRPILQRIVPAALIMALVFTTYFGMQGLIRLSGYENCYSCQETRPYTHWIMMGLNKPVEEGGTSEGWGGYSRMDDNYTASIPGYDAKKQANWEVIKLRLSKMGADGYFSFLLHKLQYTWADGSYYVPTKLERSPMRVTALHQYVLNGENNTVYRIATQSLQFALLSLIACSCLRQFFRREKTLLHSLNISFLGIILFFAIWETRSRYLVMFLPLMLLKAADGLQTVSLLPRLFKKRRPKPEPPAL